MSDYVVFIILILNTVFAVGILQRNPKQHLNRLYCGFVVAANMWVLSNYLENEPGMVGLDSLVLFLRLDFFFAIISFYLWFRFISSFFNCRLEEARREYVRWAIFFVSMASAGTVFLGDLLLRDVRFVDAVVTFGSGPLMPLYAIVLSALLFSGIGILLLSRRNAKQKKRVFPRPSGGPDSARFGTIACPCPYCEPDTGRLSDTA